MSNNKTLSFIQRVTAPTPPFFKKLRNAGIAAAATGVALLITKTPLSELTEQAVKYSTLIATVLSAVSQTTVQDNTKNQQQQQD